MTLFIPRAQVTQVIAVIFANESVFPAEEYGYTLLKPEPPTKLLPNSWPTRFGGNLLLRNRKLLCGTTEYSWAKQGHYESGILPGCPVASEDQAAKFIFDMQSPSWLAQTGRACSPRLRGWSRQFISNFNADSADHSWSTLRFPIKSTCSRAHHLTSKRWPSGC